MIRKLAVIFGIVLLVIGILGFIQVFTPSGMLFGAFAVDAMHNWMFIITGLIALAVGFSSERGSTAYFQVFGILYAILTVLGFSRGNQPVLGMVNNYADSVLHLVIAVVALYIGYVHSHMHWRALHWRH